MCGEWGGLDAVIFVEDAMEEGVCICRSVCGGSGVV